MKYTKKKNIIIISIIFLVGILAGSLSKPGKEVIKYFSADSPLYLVESVIDGDTFKIEGGERVRFININAPEKGACYYKESTQALIDLINNKHVRLLKDVSEKDRYERLLRYVVLPNESGGDDLLVEQYLAKNGFVRYMPSPPDNRYQKIISSAQWYAYNNKLGMWGVCDYVPDNINKRQENSEPENKNCIIKGNISEKGFGKTYLIPGCDNYNFVKIDTRKGEQYFCTEQEAMSAGFRKATNCP